MIGPTRHFRIARPAAADGRRLARPRRGAVAALVCLAAAGLGGCSYGRPTLVRPAPVVFNEQPELRPLLEAVNQNSARVQQLQQEAELAIEGMPQLQASIALQRPLRFRMQAESLLGPELDMGSNDQIYWLWIRREQPPTVHYGRHEQFHLTQARQILPIPPSWLISAMGIVFFDMQAMHEGPISSRPDLVEVRSQLPTSGGTIRKVSLIDWRRALVTEQHFYGPDDQRLASVRASDFDYDPTYRVALPQRIAVELPPAQLAFTLRVHTYAVNRLWVANPDLLWQPPQLPGHQYHDLAQPAPAGTAVPQGPIGAPAPRALPPLLPGTGGGVDVQAKRQRWPFWRLR